MTLSMASMLRLSRNLFIATVVVWASVSWASNEPLRLQCQLFAGGEDHVFSFAPVRHPYRAKPIDLERFRFKATVYQDSESVNYIKITVSYLSSQQALILQQATYLPPFVINQTLTGRQQLYSPELGRELSYDCAVVSAP
jgi:UDP-galactopyranose mutase